MATLVVRASLKEDLPEPVRPASRTCCEVPSPSARCCRLVAPDLPRGTSIPSRLDVEIVGAVIHGDVGGTRITQRRLARARAAGEQDVLRGALSQREVLPFGRARLTEGHVDPIPARCRDRRGGNSWRRWWYAHHSKKTCPSPCGRRAGRAARCPLPARGAAVWSRPTYRGARRSHPG